jgi:tetratricopeptide (TPR) repeat protein
VSGPDHSSERQASPPVPADDRLDSWKEIAIFLHRDVRTVQRWEKHAGLPVYRHAEARLRTAYAYRSELEAWWKTQRGRIEAAGAQTDPPAPADAAESSSRHPSTVPGSRGRWVVALGALALFGIAAAGWLRPKSDVPRPAAGRPVSVVLARLEDHAHNPALVSAIEDALSRELARGGYLETVTPARISRALRLMRRQPGAPMNEALGRELLLRDPRIRYVVTGRVRTLDSRYFVDIRALDADGRPHAAAEWQGATAGRLISHAREPLEQFAQIAARQAAATGDPGEPPAQVTSASTAAVRLYDAALQAALRGQWDASELLARRAVVLDPEFASAHAWIGWTMRRQGRSAREASPFFERALLLARDVTDQEIYLISGMFHAIGGDLRASAAALEALRRLNPSHRQALDTLIEVSYRMGRVRKAVELSLIRAESSRGDFYANVRAAQALAAARGSTERVAVYADRARRLASTEVAGDRPTWNAWLHTLPVFQRWVDGDVRGARNALNELDRGLPDRLGRERDAFASALGFAHLAFGQTRRAEQAFRYGSAPERQINLAVLALTQGDEDGARQRLSQVREYAGRSPALFARVGFTEDAERGLTSLLPSDHSEGIAAVTRGLLALRLRQIEPAAERLREGLDLLRSSGEPAYFFAAEALAAIADGRGDVGRSIGLLTDAVAEQAHTYTFPQWTAAYWIRMSTDLAQRCRRAGRHDDAERISVGLRRILDIGDPQVLQDSTPPAIR